jgi:hypothetical protein
VKQLVNSGFKSVTDPNELKIINELYETLFTEVNRLETIIAEKNALLNLLKVAGNIVNSVDDKINSS